LAGVDQGDQAAEAKDVACVIATGGRSLGALASTLGPSPDVIASLKPGRSKHRSERRRECFLAARPGSEDRDDRQRTVIHVLSFLDLVWVHILVAC
jgi:hypothetical protein